MLTVGSLHAIVNKKNVKECETIPLRGHKPTSQPSKHVPSNTGAEVVHTAAMPQIKTQKALSAPIALFCS